MKVLIANIVQNGVHYEIAAVSITFFQEAFQIYIVEKYHIPRLVSTQNIK